MAILREHLDAFGTAEDGRLFVTSGGRSFSGSAYAQVWKRARILALTPDQVESPSAARWGFTSPAHFNLAFRGAYGLSPRQFRRQCAKMRAD